MQLPQSAIKIKSHILAIGLTAIGFAVLTGAVAYLTWKAINLEKQLNQIKSTQDNLSKNLEQELFEDHLKVAESIALKAKLAALETELETLKNTSEGTLLTNVTAVYDRYAEFSTKLERNNTVKLDTSFADAELESWGAMLLEQNFESLQTEIAAQMTALDDEYDKYLATLPPPVPVGGGYSYLTVNTEVGTFGMYLIKVSKGEVTVKTIAAIEDDCGGNCPTKSLAQYASENGAWAGVAGTYSCPADYAQCAGEEWSFDFALYDSNDGRWFNEDALSWNETGMVTFNGSSTNFYEDTSDYGGGGVTAAISNYPGLVRGGEIVVSSDEVDTYQNTKGTRGVIGADDNNIYLAYVTGASVIDAAYAIRAAGATDALNLDGGGSSAMYVNGGYVVGPGRPLPNVVLLIK